MPLVPWKAYQERLPRSTVLHLYWTKNPFAKVGIGLGPVSGHVAIDIDGEIGD